MLVLPRYADRVKSFRHSARQFMHGSANPVMERIVRAIQISVETRPKGVLGRIFKFVEGGLYTYVGVVKNIGDEDLGSEARQKDPRNANLWAIEYVCRFPSGQANIHRSPFPANLAPNAIHEPPGPAHDVLPPAHPLLRPPLLSRQTQLTP